MLLGLPILAGCAAFDVAGNRDDLFDRAAKQSWSRGYVIAGSFKLLALSRGSTERRGTLSVYIEGDGLAWLDRTTVSANPTPLRPVSLRLALEDPRAGLYLGRPCQYLDAAETARCDPRYWTGRRYAPEVVEALSAAIDRYRRGSAEKIELIGYSGGGVLAALIAARRTDVARIVTVAANLDVAAWTRSLGVDAMPDSLDPAAEADRIAAIPQYHLAGADDEAVRPSVVQSYMARVSPNLPRRIVEVVKGFSHDCCWHRDWDRRIGAVRSRLDAPSGNS
jgi:hypothetical protein